MAVFFVSTSRNIEVYNKKVRRTIVNKRMLALSIFIGLLLAASLAAVFLYQSSHAPSQNQSSQSPQTQNPQTQAPQTTSPTTEPTPIPVKVFFSKHPDSDNDPTKTFPVDRTSPDLSVATYVIRQLLAGPTTKESANGYFSTVRVRSDASNCDNRDFSLVIQGGVATLRFCRTFDAIGVMSDGQAQETIMASLLQFPTIKSVIILTKDGNCQFDMSGENRCLR